IVGYKPII
ncbi:hypothetical protein AVEN_233247-1, partial [Araneus ventricosus]